MKTRWYSRKKYPTVAAKQKAYRTRKNPFVPPASADPKDWEVYLRKVGLGMSRGSCLTDAPQGKRSLITGVPIANTRN